MSVDTIRRALGAAHANRRITRSEVRDLFRAATQTGNTADAAERAELQKAFDVHRSLFTRAAVREFERLMGALPALHVPPPPAQPTGPVPTSPDRTSLVARTPWTTTYWPMAGNGPDDVGSASANLWAKEGPLAKFDALLRARGLPEGARHFELQPSLNSLIGKARGHYVPSSTLSERDAERTTGVDFNKNGKIDANVEWDFLDARGKFGTDGKKDGTMGIGWWGSCDKVALAGMLFEEPKRDVSLNGVTFTAQDIKGLLTIIAESQGGSTEVRGHRYDGRPDIIRLKDGTTITGHVLTSIDFGRNPRRENGDFQFVREGLPDRIQVRLPDGTERTFRARQIEAVGREDTRDDPVMVHETITAWLKSGRPAVVDTDSGDHVWNYNFYRADDVVYRNGLKPSWAPTDPPQTGFRGPTSGGAIVWYERTVSLSNGSTQQYRYWLEEKNGQFVNGGWDPSSLSPDFLWRPSGTPTFTGPVHRNPFVDPKLVKELYERSIAP